jgi:hypothetical protein
MIQIRDEPCVTSCGKRREAFENIGDERRQPCRFPCDLRLPSFAAREQQDIFYELREPLRFTGDDLERASPFRLRTDSTEQ